MANVNESSGSEDSSGDEIDVQKEEAEEEDVVAKKSEEERPRSFGPIRGRTLGFLGPRSRLRRRCFDILVHPYTEPIILILILLNAVVLTLQGSRALLLPDSANAPAPQKGYFRRWEDYALFALFVLFTIEAFMRMCVSGLLLDPEIPISSFGAAFSTLSVSSFTRRTPSLRTAPPRARASEAIYASAPTASSSSLDVSALGKANSNTNSVPLGPGIARQPSAAGGLARGKTFKRFWEGLTRPFALPSHSVASMNSGTVPKPLHLPSRVNSDGSGLSNGSYVPGKAHMASKSLGGPTAFHQRTGTLAAMAAGAAAATAPATTATTRQKRRRARQLALPFSINIAQTRSTLRRHVPFWRQSWGRIDSLALLGFWVSFALCVAGVERTSSGLHIGIFRALSVLRVARLLGVTKGTATIMTSLKTARPLLASVAYFVIFAIVLFSIIGIQSFKGSFRRACYLPAMLGEPATQLNNQCGSYINATTLEVAPYVLADGNASGNVEKGYVCPAGTICMEGDNPYSGIESFDTIYYALQQVVIVASANGWSPLMYSMIESEFFVSCFFFIVCILVLNFWLINLFVAVITNTFGAIRSETHKSAFGAESTGLLIDQQEEGWTTVGGKRVIAQRANRLKVYYAYTTWIWVFLALATVVLQATGTSLMSDVHADVLDLAEVVLTLAFDAEIVVRFLAELPDWRAFFRSGRNWIDTVLAVGSSVIQIPAVKRSGVYAWLTIFQLGRFYRVILVVPKMKPLMMTVFGNMYGLANMTIFLLLIDFIAALAGVQLIRGDMGDDNAMNFSEIWNSFLAVYQVASSENWTDVLYGTADAELPLGQSVIVAIFISGWLLFGNFILMQMFIAVINENFNVAEEAKRKQQANEYWARQQQQQITHGTWMRRLNPYRWVRPDPVRVKVENLPSNLVLPMQKTLVQDSALPSQNRKASTRVSAQRSLRGARHMPKKSLTMLQQLFAGSSTNNDIPLTTIRNPQRQSMAGEDPNIEETDRHLELLAAMQPTTQEEFDDVLYERRAQKADFIRDHPTFDKTFWVFSQKNSLRKFCQKLVRPPNGERIFGTPPSNVAHPIFQLIIFLAVVGGIITEGIATPIYRRNYFLQWGLYRASWFNVAEATFGLVLFIEFIIKIIADGFLFTPNAYVRSIWNILDFFIMSGILVNICFLLVYIDGLNRFVRCLKALRALRFVTLIEMMRNTFESLILSGLPRMLDAAVLAILYLIPFSVWGTNVFAGLFKQCNDQNASGYSGCTNEYVNTIYGDAFGFPVPRVWSDPSPSTTFSFDNFQASLLILFEIISLEGWIDVMTAAMALTGFDNQPQTNAAQTNAIFFLIYNLLGGVIILTIFVSIIIGNFSSKTGSAFLTQPQREWIDLQKLIKRQKPSKRPEARPNGRIRAWCYDRAIHKHGWWSRMMTTFFVIQIILMMTQTYQSIDVVDHFRDDFALFITFSYVIDIGVRLFGLGWTSFRGNGWNLFDITVAAGSFVTTLIVRFGETSFVVEQLQKLFLVSISFKLVQRTNSLNQLFKTAVASLPVVLSLLALWLVLFLFFAIMYMEVFGLTKWYSAETESQNYQTMGSALLMLAFMSTGEGWNQYMHDYTLSYPKCTSTIEFGYINTTDCGSPGWAYTLFIAWNLLSMYIFVNLFTGIVVENFSYVFQSTGGVKSINREEMRSFKKIWAMYANPKTGYLERQNLVPFLGKLGGVFETRIYPENYNVKVLVAECSNGKSKKTQGLNIKQLNRALNDVDYDAIRKRRNVYSRLYHEATYFHSKGRGISFTNMLLLLAHHKLIVDREALVLKDLVVRTEQNKLVTDLVNLDRVRSLLKMFSLRRRYLLEREAEREKARNPFFSRDIPAILVEPLPPSTPPLGSRDITSPFTDSARSEYDSASPNVSPTPSPRRLHPGSSPVDTPVLDPGFRSSLQRARRVSDTSMLSADAGLGSSRDGSMTPPEGHDDVVETMQQSLWGEMMMEAENEAS
ncbi:hypothetical protein CONPUDRAFT_167813 [Coniophora puteana RWD-64-598 SS2]|uniref:Calcium-channel protein CCH1 n=1 Tax=Coniophora puteana (strain RWD-64-598) TaxID=741705 RepID=A0A5M3MFH6_CONPW|nr:uncharacterized protein CONPUDRAFT_167813 [Coniophora puteana RWD-64-598 SS2]EIW77746.1 hypothetical protein CONPUDRAFT_167813 [Coniophora puteana RWD-64-598 SS2]